MRSCSVHVKKWVKVGLSKGGGAQLAFLLKGSGVAMNDISEKILC